MTAEPQLTARAVLRLMRARSRTLQDVAAHDAEALRAALLRQPEQAEVAPHVRRTLRAIGLGGALILLAGAFLGGGAARAVLGGGGAVAAPVNVLAVLMSLLGVQTCALMLWFTLLPMRGGSSRGALFGRLHRSVSAWITRWTAGDGSRDGQHEARDAATSVVMRSLVRGPAARWSLAAAAHGFWTGFNLGAVFSLLLLFSTRQYLFAWETTILPDRVVERVVHAMGRGPALLRLPVPDGEAIARSRVTDQVGSVVHASDADAWAGFLLGCMLMFGLAPRMLLLGGSLTLRRRALGRGGPESSDADLLSVVGGSARATTVHAREHDDASEGQGSLPGVDSRRRSAEGIRGGVFILGYELTLPPDGWPPRVHGPRFRDLGVIESSEEQREVLAALDGEQDDAKTLVIVVEMGHVPDRGVRRFFEACAEVHRGPLLLLISGAQRRRLQAGAEGVERRLRQWRDLALDLGFGADGVIDVDLDHMTQASRDRLERLLSGAPDAVPQADAARFAEGIGYVHDFIDDVCAAAEGAVAPAKAAHLHARLEQLFRGDDRREAVALPEWMANPAQVQVRLTEAGRSVIEVLPGKLRSEWRFVVAGAMCGALACAGTALLVTPMAAAAIPAWSIFGAATTAAIRAARRGGVKGDAALPSEAGGEPDELARPRRRIADAALHALLLAGQALPAALQAQVMERVLMEVPEPGDDERATLHAYIDRLAERRSAVLREGGMK